MLGTTWEPDPALKAGETKTFLFFFRDMVGSSTGVLDEAFPAAADKLDSHSSVIDLAGHAHPGVEHTNRLIPRGAHTQSVKPASTPPPG